MMFGKNSGSTAASQRIPDGSIGAEIGVWRGDSSEKFLQRAGHVHLVDPWSVEAYEDSDEFGGFRKYLKRYSSLVGRADGGAFQKYYDGVHDSVVKRFAGKPVTIHRCTSTEFFASFEGQLDWIYLDGSHDESIVYSDIESALKIADIVMGDDYGNKDGVTRAVNRAVDDFDLEIVVFARDQYLIA